MEIKFADCRTPGQLVDAALKSIGWTQRVLAIVLGMDETGINKIVADKRPINAELALLLEELFGIPAERFLELQKSYDLALARIASKPDRQRATRAQVFGGLPITDMIKRGWLSDVNDVRDVVGVEKSLAKFFGVDSINQIEILPHAAKKTAVSEDTTPVQIAWLYRVKQIASEMIVGKYSNVGVRRTIERLRTLTSAAEEARKAPRILAECGIRFVIVESLPSAKIDGVCFWLDEVSPVIGMSMRYDRIDNFWFVLRHELEHVLHEHGKTLITIDAELEGARAGTGDGVAEEERIANLAAAEFCVPQKTMDSFIARKSPVFAERDILGVAATLRIHPGLVAGQLRYRTGKYNRFSSHLVKIRAIVSPSAVVDGWGDIAQIGV
ncbi:HTH-type transcriptional regulator / antitoxin HigA [Nitrosospira sp. Nsp18]|uniref:helix-turn-helix domain-containing protein n=1 Tax=Nitrosospira sp. Nsp18 TaxID=1855334 RepID=UPI00088B0C89|nr:helix-turn-helix domain-containing protein [Nitrosospira sp. Nsp18]SDA10892.1 HTH-type transcriptional regulator / antitoxin HigA [Nitrosospira sp. Nsp18]